MPSNALAVNAIFDNKSKSPEDIKKTLDSRQSNDLIFAFCGAIGSRINEDIVPVFKESLESEGYICHVIRISELIKNTAQENPSIFNFNNSELDNKFKRYTALQDLGNNVRKQFGDDSLARLCIKDITIKRKIHNHKDTDKVAYLITQIKHPSEVSFFRLVYSNIFYLIGILCSEEQRRHNLTDKERIASSESAQLIERDRNENDSHGQKLEKVLHASDFFISNNQSSSDHRQKIIKRLIGLNHGTNGLTPTSQESGMYAAHIASLRSACLSRQVGAAILNEEGNIIATGCNDVPKFGGGLYNSESIQDNRCVHYEDHTCFNDTHKKILTEDISNKILSTLDIQINELLESPQISNYRKNLEPLLQNFKKKVSQKTTLSIATDTQIKDLIEYSRAIHAEMDAILSLARQASHSTRNSTLYTTTYPCHNCARHIVTAGIEKVIYIEPYEKSLATKLHHDSISKNNSTDQKVAFLPFEGVSPKRYPDFFKAQKKRKDENGKAIKIKVIELNHVMPEYLDSYKDREKKVVEHLEDSLNQ